MATTTATVTLSSADMMDNNVSISNTATLTNQGSDTGMTKTTGLTRLTTSAVSNVVLIDSGASGGVQAVEIGRLYGGDWAFLPFEGGAGNDVEITPSSTTDTTLEYIVFYE